MPGIQAGIKAGQKIRGMAGKAAAQATRTAKTGMSSGVMASAKNSRVGKAVMKNPKMSATIGGAALGGVAMSRNRKSGLNKGKTGMYNY